MEVALEHAETLRCDDLLRTGSAMSRAWSMMYARTYVAEVENAWLTAIAFARARATSPPSCRRWSGFPSI